MPHVVVAAATGVAASLVVAPLAYAASADHATGPAPSGLHPQPAPHDATPTPTSAPAPDYGYQKIRIGVQIKDGSWVPPDTTTAGSVVTVTETGPGAAGAIFNNGLTNGECTTDASTTEPGGTATYCVIPGPNVPSVLRRARALRPSVSPGDFPSDQQYTASPGDTVTLTQKTVEPNLKIDTVTQTVTPCTVAESGDNVCQDAQVIIFNDPGFPPHAVDDNAGTIKTGASKNVKVINNDTTYGTTKTYTAPYSIMLNSPPKHGTAKALPVSGSAARREHAKSVTSGTTFHYKSSAGYAGPDSFTYTLTTPNGSSTATVRIKMVAPKPTPTPTPKPTPKPSKSVLPKHQHRILPDTGWPSQLPLEIALAFIVAGAAIARTLLVRRGRSDQL